MHLAFNTALVPHWTLTEVPARAAALGYAGVEVHLPRAGSDEPAADSIVIERDLVKLAFDQAAAVRLEGLSTSIHFPDAAAGDEVAAVRRVVALAARLGCPRVRLLDMAVRPGRSYAQAALRLADRLLPLADHAGDAGVTLLVQNALTFRTATAMWRLVEQVDHPSLAVAWDPLSSSAAGEDPMVAVPVLNSRIHQVLLRDATLSTIGANGSRRERQVVSLTRIGDGELDLRRTLDRLRGIGFAGPVVVSYPADLPAGVGPAEDLLAEAAKTFQQWTPAPPTRKSGGKAVA